MDGPAFHLPTPCVTIERRGRNAWLAWIVLALSLPVFAAACYFTFATSHPPDLGLFVLIGSMPVWLGSASVLIRQRFEPAVSAVPRVRTPGELGIENGALAVRYGERARHYPPGSVIEGWIEDLGEQVTVVLRSRSGDLISLDVPGVEPGRALLAAAGVSAEQQVFRMRLANATTQMFGGGCLASIASVVLTVVGLLSLIAVLTSNPSPIAGAWLAGDLLLFLILIRVLTPAQVVIGADGVTLERLVTRRFIPFRAIERVTWEPGAVVLVAGKKSIRLPTGDRHGARIRAEVSPQAALFNRLNEARAAGKLGSSAHAVVGELDRAGRPLAAWRERLRQLTRSEALYRRLAVSREQLAVVLEDAGAPAERRIAAALALSGVDEPEMKRRVSAAVATCADPRLRVALSAAGEDTLSEDTLEAIVREEAKRS